MKLLTVYPTDKSIDIACFEGGTKLGQASIPYPECECEIGSVAETVKNTFGMDSFDVGITCYGMSAKTDKAINNLTPELVDSICQAKYGFEKTNFGTIILASIGAKKMISAYPLTYDILPPVMRVLGVAQVERRMVGRFLDHQLAFDAFKKQTGKTSFVTCYLSTSEITIAAWKDGAFVSMNSSWDGEGPMTPTRSGFFHQKCVYKMAVSGKYTLEQLQDKVRTVGGIFAHLGTSDLTEVRSRIASGDKKAEVVYNAMIYQITKSIGRGAVLSGKHEGVVFTGPLSTDKDLVDGISKSTAFIGQHFVAPKFEGTDVLAGLA